MARKSLAPAPLAIIAYRGYLIHTNPITQQVYISNNSFHIAYASTVEDAKRTIEMLTE